MADRPLRVGIISANWSLRVHGPAWRRIKGVEVAAICTAHQEMAEAAAREFDVEAGGHGTINPIEGEDHQYSLSESFVKAYRPVIPATGARQ